MNEKEQFIANLYPAATKVSQETGMSMELMLAQAAQETGWGERVLSGTHNIFNIKASPDWHGPTKTFTVVEFEHGKKVMVNAEFRIYGSVEEALRDRVKFLQENPRYAHAGLFDSGIKGNLEREAAALQKAGYATDPKYAEQLAAVYNGPTMQRAIKHAQGQTSAPEHATIAPTGQTHTTVHGHLHAGVLIQGTHGTAVQTLQDGLSKLGYTDGHGHALRADGDYGPNTRHAVEAFQRDHHLSVDGKAGPHTLVALHATNQPHVGHAQPHLDDKHHPDHALYRQALAGVNRIDAAMRRSPDQHSANLAGVLTVAAKTQGLTRIDTVVLSEDGSRAFAVQHDSPLRMLADVPAAQAVNTPLPLSSAAALTAPPTHPPQQNQPLGQILDASLDQQPSLLSR